MGSDITLVFRLFSVLLLFMHLLPAKCEKLVFIRELDKISGQRSLEPLPDHIPVELAAGDTKLHLVLERNYDVDLDRVRVLVKEGGVERVVDLSEKTIGFYTDVEKNAVIKVDATDLHKRKYSGELIHEDTAYELHPLEVAEDTEKELRTRALHQGHSDDVLLHALREVDITDSLAAVGIEVDQTVQRGNYDPNDIKKLLRSQNDGSSDDSSYNDEISVTREPVDIFDTPKAGVKKRSIEGDDAVSDDKLRHKLQELLSLLHQKKAEEKKDELGTADDDVEKDLTEHTWRRTVPDAPTDPDANYQATIVMLVDYSVWKYWTEDLKYAAKKAESEIGYYMSHMFNGLSMAYRRITEEEYGFTVLPWLQKIIIFKSESDVAFMRASSGTIDGSAAAKSLYEYRQDNPDYGWTDVAHIMFLTKLKIKVGDSSPVGVSPICSACDPYYGYSVVKDRGHFSWLTAAHELAHNLGGKHDGDSNECSREDMNIMTPFDVQVTQLTLENAFKFSSCTVRAMRGCLSGKTDGIGKPCVKDKACRLPKQPLIDIKKTPGEKYKLDAQCKMFVDRDAVYDESCNVDICQRLYCKLNGKCYKDSYKELKALPGSTCSKNKWCMWGVCTKKNVKQYYDTSCRKKRSTLNDVPKDCPPDSANVDCARWAESDPIKFFKDPQFLPHCHSTMHRYGLNFDYQDVCYIKRIDQISCSSDKTVAIYHTQILDGKTDCSGGEDEKPSFAMEMALKFPYCFSDSKIHCFRDFNKCVSPKDVVAGQANCPYEKGEEEQFIKLIKSYKLN